MRQALSDDEDVDRETSKDIEIGMNEDTTARKEIEVTKNGIHVSEPNAGSKHNGHVISDPLIEIKDFSFSYGENQVINNMTMDIPGKEIVAMIGPSGCGKSTLLRSINRMNDIVDDPRYVGDILIHGDNIFHPDLDVIALRRHIGMVFQKSNPFPKSIYENVVYGLRIAGRRYRKNELDEIVERCLNSAALWDEVKDRLNDSAFGLSGGQMQRLCIARAIANEPEILLMDEPCSALDPIATSKIEELILELKEKYSIVIVTHNMQQASRISDRAIFLFQGDLIEYDFTENIFSNPKEKRTEEYISGRIG